MQGRNKPATHAEVKKLGMPIEDTGLVADRVYRHKYPNRQQRRQEAKFSVSAHNNRAHTKARKDDQHEIKKIVITGRTSKGTPIYTKVATGVIRTVRKINDWIWGGNTTQPR